MEKVKSVLVAIGDQSTSFGAVQLLKALNLPEELNLASTGKEGLHLVMNCSVSIYNECPDLIVLGELPDIDPVEFIHTLENIYFRNRPLVKIILLTNKPEEAHASLKASEFQTYCFQTPLTEEKLEEAFRGSAAVI